jgi:predicted nucleotidyltransferase component of viral defense system
MIPRRYIDEWQKYAPWPDVAQVEQDLIIERALVELFSDDFLVEHLAFRGGTALHKLFLKPQVRYSEDIDLVQVKDGPIKPILQKIRERMKFLGTRRSIKQNENNNTILYRFESEVPPVINLRLKIEINCREHQSVLGIQRTNFESSSTWFRGSSLISTYEIEELLGTKAWALYQRRKGRDLFDLYWAVKHFDPDLEKIGFCYKKYMEFVVEKVPTFKQFRNNIEEKMVNPEFIGDMSGLVRSGKEYDLTEAYQWFMEDMLIHLHDAKIGK